MVSRKETCATQLVSAGCSSLRKKPRNLTLGEFWTFAAGSTKMSGFFLGGTSAQKYHGLTPICSLTS